MHTTHKYVYQLPYQVKKELCRLFDNDEDWKVLADKMKYSMFQINEIEQAANLQKMSTTEQLLIRWGHHNHSISELFVLLYKMKNVPAMRCIYQYADPKYIELIEKYNNKVKNGKILLHENIPRYIEDPTSGTPKIPKPVLKIQQGYLLMDSEQVAHSDSVVESNSKSSVRVVADNVNKKNLVIKDKDRINIEQISEIRKLDYEDLRVATNNWSNSNLLGRGGYGKVYEGFLEVKLSQIAVKVLNCKKDDDNKELIREMCLNEYRHDNILPLYGYSLGGGAACLVYQYMAGGSLDKRLKGKTHHSPLTWEQRHRIACGVASGLHYLHSMKKPSLIHGDIKPANILLDQSCIPKIGDFGLARKGSQNQENEHVIVSKVYGTSEYLPWDYKKNRFLSTAVDVYSYGVVVLQLATGLSCKVVVDVKTKTEMLLTDYMRDKHQRNCDMAQFEDSVLLEGISSPQLCRGFISVGLQCIANESIKRPTMKQVYKSLIALKVPEPAVM